LEKLQAQVDAGNPYAIEAMAKAPQEFNEFYWWAFGELISERPVGMSPGPIPYSAISRFADEHGIRGYERYVFHYCLRAMDNLHLKRIQERAEQASKAKQTSRLKG
jgi:hypothetical protein